MPRWLTVTRLLIGLLAALVVDMAWGAYHYGLNHAGDLEHCRAFHPTRHHGFKPNCTSMDRHFGREVPFTTNNLGLRDQAVRSVAAIPDRPRLLILGDGQTQGPSPWDQSVVGRIAHGLPFYEVLNGGAASYAPSVYLQIVNDLTSAGYEFDEVLVFMDVSDVQDEAAFYHDRPAGGVTGPARWADDAQWYVRLRDVVRRHLRGTNYLVERLEMALVSAGGFHLQTVGWGAIFDGARSAWPYRKIHETGLKFPAGYAPLGEEAGLAKAVRKMDRLSAQLRSRHISLSLAVYPWPAQLAYDDRASRHLKIWREWCNTHCVRFISAYGAMFAEKDRCSEWLPGCWYRRLFIFGDTHYNDMGASLIADGVIKAFHEAAE